MRHYRAVILSGLSFAVVGLVIGFWLGRVSVAATTSDAHAPHSGVAYIAPPQSAPAPPQGPILPAPQAPADLVTAIRASRLEQERLVGQLLTWLDPIQRQGKGKPLDVSSSRLDYSPMTAARAITLFGELRYAPATDLLVRVSVEGGLGGFWEWGTDVWDSEIDHPPDPRELARRLNARLDRIPLPQRDVVGESLVNMGPPVAPGLVEGYVRLWKMPLGEEREEWLRHQESLLSNDSLTAAALVAIQRRLAKIDQNRTGEVAVSDRDEWDALQRLKRGLILKLEHPEYFD